MKVLTINCDLDGVVVRFAKQMHEMCEGYEGRKLPPWTDWSPWSAWDMDQSQWFEYFERCVLEGVFYHAEEFSGAVEALHDLINSRHRVRFVTSKVLRTEEATEKAILDCTKWLADRGLLRNDIELCFTHNKQGYEADVIIDDKPDLSWGQHGALNLLFDQPWNREIEAHDEPQHAHHHGIDPWIVRVHGWSDVLKRIDQAAG